MKILTADAVPSLLTTPSYFTKKKPPERSQMTGEITWLEADKSTPASQWSSSEGLTYQDAGWAATQDGRWDRPWRDSQDLVSRAASLCLFQPREASRTQDRLQPGRLSRFFLWHPPGRETTAVFGRILSSNFRQDYGYMRTSQHTRLCESTIGECSLIKVPNWRPRRQLDRGNRRRVHAGRENHKKTTLPHRAAETGNDLTLWTLVLSQSPSLRSYVGELQPVIVQADAQRKCPVSTFHRPSAHPVKDLLHGHQTNWQHPLLHGCENQANFRTRAACSLPHRRDPYRPASGIPVRKSYMDTRASKWPGLCSASWSRRWPRTTETLSASHRLLISHWDSCTRSLSKTTSSQ